MTSYALSAKSEMQKIRKKYNTSLIAEDLCAVGIFYNKRTKNPDVMPTVQFHVKGMSLKYQKIKIA